MESDLVANSKDTLGWDNTIDLAVLQDEDHKRRRPRQKSNMISIDDINNDVRGLDEQELQALIYFFATASANREAASNSAPELDTGHVHRAPRKAWGDVPNIDNNAEEDVREASTDFKASDITLYTAEDPEQNKNCERCKSINCLALFEFPSDSFPPKWWKAHHSVMGNASASFELRKLFAENREQQLYYHNLGPWKDMQFEASCCLCALLSALMPPEPVNPENGMFLIPFKGIHRLEPHLDWSPQFEGDLIMGKRYSKYLYIGQKPDATRPQDYTCDKALNAAGMINDHLGNYVPEYAPYGMPVRQVNSSLGDFKLVHAWLNQCEQLHNNTCKIVRSPDLRHIRLIDVIAKTVVRFPAGTDCRYFCLSYVCGSQNPLFDSSNLDFDQLPSTIADAMAFVRKMGERYLWVDSICINQSDEVDKQTQIDRMSSIYTGAWATIVALEGSSVHAGLARVNPATHTLSQTSQTVVKASRAWTYQEAIVSPRCLYFTSDQVYFECNGHQCCEAIDETKSPWHRLPNITKVMFHIAHSDHYTGTWKMEEIFGNGFFREPTTNFADERSLMKGRLRTYNELICEYSRRNMTLSSDVLRASRSLIQLFEQRLFVKGLFGGLPAECLPYVLLWYHQGEPKRRKGFPSWSWAGWEGALASATSIENEGHWRHYPNQVPLKAWYLENRSLELIFEGQGKMKGIGFYWDCQDPEKSVEDIILKLRSLVEDATIDKLMSYDPPSNDLKRAVRSLAKNESRDKDTTFDFAFDSPAPASTSSSLHLKTSSLPLLLFLEGFVLSISAFRVRPARKATWFEIAVDDDSSTIWAILQAYDATTISAIQTQKSLAPNHVPSLFLLDSSRGDNGEWYFDLILLEWVMLASSSPISEFGVESRFRKARRVGRTRLIVKIPPWDSPIEQLSHLRAGLDEAAALNHLYVYTDMKRDFVVLE